MMAQNCSLKELMHNAEGVMLALREKLQQPKEARIVVEEEARFITSESMGGAVFVWTYNDVLDIGDTTKVCAAIAARTAAELLDVAGDEEGHEQCFITQGLI